MKEFREQVIEKEMGLPFPPQQLLFQLPSLALAGGLLLITLFVIKTDAAINAKKKAAEAAKLKQAKAK